MISPADEIPKSLGLKTNYFIYSDQQINTHHIYQSIH